jgi:hypothetical protein
MREYQLEHGVPRAQVYDTTAYILCGLLAIGVVCNFFVKPVADKHFMTDAELEAERKLAHEQAMSPDLTGRFASGHASAKSLVIIAWLAVGIPLAWGVAITLEKAWVLFR